MYAIPRVRLYTVIFLIIAAASVFRFYHLGAVEMIADEYRDIPAARAYAADPNPFIPGVQKNDDISQARMPYYITALSLRLSGDPLSRARLPSAIFGVLAVLITYLIGRELYDVKTGILSALLLAISTYHIGFSRFSATTGESHDLFFFLLSLLLFFKGITGRETRPILFSGITTGLAIASKFSMALLIPVFFLYMLSLFRGNCFKISRINKILLRITYLNLAVIISFAFISFNLYGHAPGGLSADRIFILFLSAVLFYLPLLFIAIFRTGRLFDENDALPIFFNMVLTCAAFTFIGSPVHLDPANLTGALRWFGEFGYNNSLETGPLYFLNPIATIFLRMAPPFNLIFIPAFLYTVSRSRNGSDLLISMVFILYLAFLSSLKWFMSWYVMPLMPLALIMSSHFTVLWIEKLRRKTAYPVALFLISVSIALQLPNLLRISPYYQIDGYRFGSRFIGLNKPSFLTTEGVKDAIAWLEKNIPDRSRVGFFINLRPINDHLAGYLFRWVAGIHARNRTIEYDYAFDTKKIDAYDYLAVSPLLKRRPTDKNGTLRRIHTVSVAGLDVLYIYEIVI
ncbi:MAG: glycosyltransferase family 39 protein [Candidatus Omnitrophota bacterium]